jgi:ArsR family metal-binding transcriptional regulator
MSANTPIDEIREIVQKMISDGRIKVRKKHSKGDYKGLKRLNCGHCGVEFDQVRKHQKWCSSNCLNKAWQKRNKPPIPPRDCWKCGVEFTPSLLPQAKNCDSCRSQPGFRLWMRRASEAHRREFGTSRVLHRASKAQTA